MTIQDAIKCGALSEAWPGKSWSFDLSKSDYSGLTWMDESPKPTQSEFDSAISAFSIPDLSDINNLDRKVRALGLLIAQYTGKAPATVRSDFMAIYKGLE